MDNDTFCSRYSQAWALPWQRVQQTRIKTLQTAPRGRNATQATSGAFQTSTARGRVCAHFFAFIAFIAFIARMAFIAFFITGSASAAFFMARIAFMALIAFMAFLMAAIADKVDWRVEGGRRSDKRSSRQERAPSESHVCLLKPAGRPCSYGAREEPLPAKSSNQQRKLTKHDATNAPGRSSRPRPPMYNMSHLKQTAEDEHDPTAVRCGPKPQDKQRSKRHFKQLEDNWAQSKLQSTLLASV